MIINKTGSALRSSLTLTGASYATSARAWRYDGSDLGHLRQVGAATIRGGVSRLTYPARSITLLVIPRR